MHIIAVAILYNTINMLMADERGSFSKRKVSVIFPPIIH